MELQRQDGNWVEQKGIMYKKKNERNQLLILMIHLRILLIKIINYKKARSS